MTNTTSHTTDSGGLSVQRRCVPSGYENQSGVALLITITVLFVITALVTTVNMNIRAAMERVQVTKERARLKEMAVSGVQIGIGILMEEDRKSVV
jgi:type II secretory pathway component PulK